MTIDKPTLKDMMRRTRKRKLYQNMPKQYESIEKVIDEVLSCDDIQSSKKLFDEIKESFNGAYDAFVSMSSVIDEYHK